MMEAPTTEELLDDAEARTGLARGQLLMMVAKSAAVRHLACHPDYRGIPDAPTVPSPGHTVDPPDYCIRDTRSLPRRHVD
jgi:hypothetical protein